MLINPLASWFLINIDFLLLNTAYFDKSSSFLSFAFATFGFLLSASFLYFLSSNTTRLSYKQIEIFIGLSRFLDFWLLFSHHHIFLTHYLLKKNLHDKIYLLIKALKIKTFRLFNLTIANNTILSYFCLFLSSWLYFKTRNAYKNTNGRTKNKNANTSSNCRDCSKCLTWYHLQTRPGLILRSLKNWNLILWTSKKNGPYNFGENKDRNLDFEKSVNAFSETFRKLNVNINF